MEEEILNIEHHKKRLIIKALNKCRCVMHAADRLGVSYKGLYKMMRRYKVRYYMQGFRRIYYLYEDHGKIFKKESTSKMKLVSQ